MFNMKTYDVLGLLYLDSQSRKLNHMIFTERYEVFDSIFGSELLLEHGTQLISCSVFQSKLNEEPVSIVAIHAVSNFAHLFTRIACLCHFAPEKDFTILDLNEQILCFSFIYLNDGI